MISLLNECRFDLVDGRHDEEPSGWEIIVTEQAKADGERNSSDTELGEMSFIELGHCLSLAFSKRSKVSNIMRE